MKKNKNIKLEPLEADALSCDLSKPDHLNQSITDHNIKNNLSIDTAENKPAIRKTKTKTTRPNSVKKPRVNKKLKSPRKNRKNKNDKKVKFIEKVDIVKVECWKQYNIEQTAEEVEFIDDIMDDMDGDGNDTKANTDKSNTNSSNEKKNNKKKNKNNNDNGNKKGKGKKKNYTCACNIM